MAIPQILQQLNRNSMLQIKQAAQMMKSIGNPQMMMEQILAKNPQVANIIKQYGGNPRTAFYEVARQKGVDPEEILSSLR